MNTSLNVVDTRRDDCAGTLTDAALAVTARHGVAGPSVDLELDLWRSLGDVVRDGGPRHDESVLAELTDAAYQVALAHKPRGSFVDLQLDLWRSLRRVLSSSTLRRQPC